MTARERITAVLAGALKDLAQLSSELAVAQDFAGSTLANDVASRVANLARQPEDDISPSCGHTNKLIRTRRVRSKTSPGRKRAQKGEYPKFYVRNGTLFRVAWSKRTGAEYIHKVTRPVFDEIVRALRELGRKGLGPYATETVVEQLGGDIPSYQTYVTLGMLQEHACVKKCGREGYEVIRAIEEQAQRAWANCEQQSQ